MSLLPLVTGHSFLETNCFSLSQSQMMQLDSKRIPIRFVLFSLFSLLFSLSTSSSSSMPLQFLEFRRIFSPQNKWRKTSEQRPCFTQIVLRMVVRVWYNIESTTTNFSHDEHHFLRKNTTRSDLNTYCWIAIIIFETADLKAPNTVLEEDSVLLL